MEQVKITIVGAGAIGLAVASELSKDYSDIVLIERNSSFGEEASSRNSEIIHAGIYYPRDSLKARLCVEGRRLLYTYCNQNSIGHKKVGKLIVAVNSSEEKTLKALLERGLGNGVSDLTLLSGQEVKRLEPHINALAAVYSPSTGIVDSHSLMKQLEYESQGRGVHIAYKTTLEAVEKSNHSFKVSVRDEREGVFNFITEVFINAAGLCSDRVAGMAGINNPGYSLKYCKGNYFRVHSSKAKLVKYLVYPVPSEAGLGIHTVPDLNGGLKLGPDAEYIDKIDYNVDESKGELFYESVRPFLPFIELDDLSPDMAGIRAKLQGPDEGFRDFLIREEKDKGLAGFINLIGIDSPGLTCALSIAQEVKNIVKPLSA